MVQIIIEWPEFLGHYFQTCNFISRLLKLHFPCPKLKLALMGAESDTIYLFIPHGLDFVLFIDFDLGPHGPFD